MKLFTPWLNQLVLTALYWKQPVNLVRWQRKVVWASLFILTFCFFFYPHLLFGECSHSQPLQKYGCIAVYWRSHGYWEHFISLSFSAMMNDVKSIFAWGARSINAEDQHLSHQVMQISSEVIVFFTQTHHNYLSKTYCEIKYG